MTNKPTTNLTFIDLFAGIGGFHFAFHNLGFECVFASEVDNPARKSYEHNFKNISPQLFEGLGLPNFNQDITKQDPKEIPDFDVLCGGSFRVSHFPSQGIERVLMMKGEEI